MQVTLTIDAQLATALTQKAVSPSLAVERYIGKREGHAVPPLPARGGRVTLSLTEEAWRYIRSTSEAAGISTARAARDVLLFALGERSEL